MDLSCDRSRLRGDSTVIERGTRRHKPLSMVLVRMIGVTAIGGGFRYAAGDSRATSFFGAMAR